MENSIKKRWQDWSVAYSSCPNDTFMFGDMRAELAEVELADVESLNAWAFEGRFDVTKLSFHAWLHLQDSYRLLRVGSAMGRGCGPLVVMRKGGEELKADARIALPGRYTTAHLLLRLWRPALENRIFMPFSEIMDAVAAGQVDAGVIIHEGRFVYPQYGLCCYADLGSWWESETGFPIPLGCIAVKSDLPLDQVRAFEDRLALSIRTAQNDFSRVQDYVRQHAQEMDDAVMRRHIETYVNQFSIDGGDEGLAAVQCLQRRAGELGLILSSEVEEEG